MQKYAAVISYIGTEYHGWQRQEEAQPSVQGCLERAISRVANHTVGVTCCGRTDAGVHAIGQVIHFTSTAKRDLHQWLLGVNTYLPADIRMLEIKAVASDFNARFSCHARSYRYVIWTERQAPVPMLAPYVYFHPHTLDIDCMVSAAHSLVGKRDCSPFRASGCQAAHPERTILQADLKPFSHGVCLDIKANAFLYHMVRIIAGDLLMLGRGLMTEAAWNAILNTCIRPSQMRPLPANGLMFMEAHFDTLKFNSCATQAYPFNLIAL